ncbi:hypothetical protein BDN71DRAFT_1437067 [Pleurotus eryngii]|uniref:Uncharacterized protein n=1 Tax=Pleurotus eryngii TaxID=5323 RepID=A0A9P5ZG72_PLEER|nr:hypothetical protein BDN71DRAFT_1437067 [Pleurotus eryngii]
MGHGAWGPAVFVVSIGNIMSTQILHHVLSMLAPPPLPPHLPTITSPTSPVEAAHPVTPWNMPMPLPIAAYSGIRAVGAGSTNDRWVNAYQWHASSGSAPAVTSQPSSQPNDSAKFSIDLGLLPVALLQAPMWSEEIKLEPPPMLNLNDHQIATLQEKLKGHNLVLMVEVSANGSVHAAFNKQIEDFCIANQFTLKPRSNANHTLSSTLVANFNWTFYVPLHRTANHAHNFGAKILTADAFTAATLRCVPFGKNVANHTSPQVFTFIALPSSQHPTSTIFGVLYPVQMTLFTIAVFTKRGRGNARGARERGHADERSVRDSASALMLHPPSPAVSRFRREHGERQAPRRSPQQRQELSNEASILEGGARGIPKFNLHHSDTDSEPPSPSELFPAHRTTLPERSTNLPLSMSAITASPTAACRGNIPTCKVSMYTLILNGFCSSNASATSSSSTESRLPAGVPFEHIDALFAEAWVDCVHDALPPRPGGPENCPGVESELVPLFAFLNPHRSFRVGEGIGSEPEHAVLSHTINIISSNAAFWQQGVGHSPLYRRTTFSTHGFLCLIHLLNIPAAPFPIHLLLLYLVIDGHMAFTIDLPFLQEIDEDLVKTLCPWMSWDCHSSLPLHEQSTDLHGLLAACEIPTNCLTDDMGDSELDGIEHSMLSYFLFGSRGISHHTDYLAFCEGFNLSICKNVSVLDPFLVEEEVKKKKNDLLLRSQLLLTTLTGSNMLPTLDHWCLSFNISHKAGPDVHQVTMPPLMNIHTCFHTADVTLDVSFRKILQDPMPKDS